MDYNSPTAADYAWSAASDAQDKAKSLEEQLKLAIQRIAVLEEKVLSLQMQASIR